MIGISHDNSLVQKMHTSEKITMDCSPKKDASLKKN
jgi:hypothetical protein